MSHIDFSKEIKTVFDLHAYLKSTAQSPEQVALHMQISNMTIRRMLRKPPSTPIPPKYRLQFQQLVPAIKHVKSLSNLLTDLQNEGTTVDASKLQVDLRNKLLDKSISADFRKTIKVVAHAAFKSHTIKTKALALGALVYLVNPFDLIPDALGVVGYLDDFAVITMACDAIRRSSERKSADDGQAQI